MSASNIEVKLAFTSVEAMLGFFSRHPGAGAHLVTSSAPPPPPAEDKTAKATKATSGAKAAPVQEKPATPPPEPSAEASAGEGIPYETLKAAVFGLAKVDPDAVRAILAGYGKAKFSDLNPEQWPDALAKVKAASGPKADAADAAFA